MKSLLSAKKFSDTGVLILPEKTRQLLGIKPNDDLEISVEGTSIILRKYTAECVFCNDTDNVTAINDKYICRECLEAWKSQVR
ncbi:MAG: AbrB/MazE/SpoVT family DNA-binding domain-containing protein [Negativicutes bacterium]|nr:AbrB/MazE/SpoVT family DNA-binding domain-containing protein [Negativicutes bacterium]